MRAGKRKTLFRLVRRASLATYAVLVLLMAAATVFEYFYGAELSHKYFYEADYFVVLWVFALFTTAISAHGHWAWIPRLGRWLRKTASRLFALAALVWMPVHTEAHTVICQAEADSLSRTQVVYQGRVCPLHTAAREFLLKLTGRTSFEGLSATQVMVSWQRYPEQWQDVRIIKVSRTGNTKQIPAGTGVAAIGSFLTPDGQYKLTPGVYLDIDERVSVVLALIHGEWYAPLPPHAEPLSAQRVRAEILYHTIPWDTILFAACFTLALTLFLLRLMRPASGRRRIIKGVSSFLKIALAVLSLVSLALRWYISEHIPLTSTYETLLVVAFTSLCVACVTARRDIPPLLVAGCALLVAHIGSLNPQVTALQPALASPWLSFHVTTIMISYCLFALLLFTPHRPTLVWAEILLGAGIILGAIWARGAWGSYWQWDPKETWALISFIVYSFPLHPATLPWFRSPRHQKLYLRLAFLTILMTYFGCNYLLSGLHSYAG